MLFNSFSYIAFLIVAVVAYWNLPRNGRLWMLFAASILFYGLWRWEYTFLILTTVTLDFFVAQRIAATADQSRKKRWLCVSLFTNIGLLVYFKYTIFIVGSLSGLLTLFGQTGFAWPWAILLPIGISFYTFQSIGYTIDVYRGFTKPVREYSLYATFVTFFPQLIAGPVLRANEVIPQLDKRPSFNPSDIATGLGLILSGLFLKVVLADNIAPLVDTAFQTPVNTLSALDVWVMAFLFGFQIYFDFSAFSQIAIGSARLMGISFPNNFNFPYVATSPRDFWKRWHISLSSWIRDYLYLPLAGITPHDVSTGGLSEAVDKMKIHQARATFALVATWIIMGLWHGANWTFALWGLWHAVLILLYRFVIKVKWPQHTLLKLCGWGLTLPLIMLSWIPFRAQSIDQALAMLAHTLTPSAYLNFEQLNSGYIWAALPINIDPLNYLLAASLMAGMILCWGTKTYLWRRLETTLTGNILQTGFLAVLTFFVFIFLKTTGQFIYFQF